MNWNAEKKIIIMKSIGLHPNWFYKYNGIMQNVYTSIQVKIIKNFYFIIQWNIFVL